jgi:hypothetical protein
MNVHTKAQINMLRELAHRGEEWLEDPENSNAFERQQMKNLVEDLRTRAARLETVEPDPRARVLTRRRERMKDLIGRQVRNLRTIRLRSGVEYPAGTVWTIEGHWRGDVHISNGMWYPWDKALAPFPVADRELVEKQLGQGSIGGRAGYVRRVSLHDLELIPK